MLNEPGHPLRLRRSVLMTPGDDERLLIKAARSAADVNVLDWQDGVSTSRKQLAHEISRDALSGTDWSAHEVVVRLNAVNSTFIDADIEAAALLPINGVRIAMTTSVADVLYVVERLTKAEAARPVEWPRLGVWSSIETVRGLLAVDDIAACSMRLSALSLGAGDLGVELGVLRLELGENRTLGPIRYEYLYAQGRLVAAARAHGLDAINTAYLSYKDLEGTKRDARFAAQMGFSGCIAISPRQAPVINEAFTPSDSDVAWAHSVVDDFEESLRDRERTVIVENDEMVDGPLVVNARRILERRNASDMKKSAVGA